MRSLAVLQMHMYPADTHLCRALHTHMLHTQRKRALKQTTTYFSYKQKRKEKHNQMKWNEKKRSEMKWNYFMSARCCCFRVSARSICICVCLSPPLTVSLSLSHRNIINFCLFKVCALSDCCFLHCLFAACLLRASLEFQFQRYNDTKIQYIHIHCRILVRVEHFNLSHKFLPTS